jgi:5-formyltetrahydrofolate cyclo-ligase
VKRASPEQNDAAYAEWQRRKKREDRVKRNHEKLTRQLQEQAEKLQHLTRWKKKDVVCAYSNNHRSAQPHPVVKPLQKNMLVA